MISDKPEWVSGGPPVSLFAAADPRLVALAGQKHHIRAKAIELGVPVADGEVVTLPFAGGRRRRL